MIIAQFLTCISLFIHNIILTGNDKKEFIMINKIKFFSTINIEKIVYD